MKFFCDWFKQFTGRPMNIQIASSTIPSTSRGSGDGSDRSSGGSSGQRSFSR